MTSVRISQRVTRSLLKLSPNLGDGLIDQAAA
jgi:hypothetical protein